MCNHCYTSPITVAASAHWLSTCRDAFLFEDCVEDEPLRNELPLERVQAVDGMIAVPEGPGLGVEVDWAAVEGFRVDPDYRKPQPREIHTIFWPDGRQTQYKDGGYRADFLAGKLPVFLPGIRLERRLDDGSDEFDRTWTERFG